MTCKSVGRQPGKMSHYLKKRSFDFLHGRRYIVGTAGLAGSISVGKGFEYGVPTCSPITSATMPGKFLTIAAGRTSGQEVDL